MVGFGYDSHIFAQDIPFMVGGVKLESSFGCKAHSDGDALLHALVDSLLGAMGKGDIGEFYPDSNSQFKNADSSVFLKETIEVLNNNYYKIINIDITILLEKPNLKHYKPLIKKNLAMLCRVDESRINIKAKTNEGMGFVGRKEGIAVFCICQIEGTNIE